MSVAEHIDALSDRGRAALAALVANGEMTRPQLTVLLGLSKPTVSAAMAELERSGLAGLVRRQQGATGRSATVFGLGPRSGWVLGLDLGSTRVRVTAHALDGTLIDERHHEGPRQAKGGAERLMSVARALVRDVTEGVDRGRLLAAGVAVPHIVPPGLDRNRPGQRIGRTELTAMIAALGLDEQTPVQMENNVNCAALAELDRGAARGRSNVVYVQVGVAIGAGIIAGGRLLRGARGGAGEIAWLPFPWGPEQNGKTFGLERYLGSKELLARCRSRWPRDSRPPRTAAALFDRAAEGHPVAMDIVREHGRDIGRLVVAMVAVLDPQIVVLGGGVGQNPQLLPVISDVVRRVNTDVEVIASALGDQATVQGAATLARERALVGLLGDRYDHRVEIQ